MSDKQKNKILNLNSEIFDDLYGRNQYMDIIVDDKVLSIEKGKFNFNNEDPINYSDQLYIDYKLRKPCKKGCKDCNLNKKSSL